MSPYEWKSLVRDNKQQQSIKHKKLQKKKMETKILLVSIEWEYNSQANTKFQ